MPAEVNNNMGAQNFSYFSALAVLDILDQLKVLADSMLKSQTKVVDTLVKGDREQERQLEQLTKKLEAARVPQTIQQLTAIRTKIEEALPKFQQLGDTDMTTRLNAMLNNVDDLKRQMAQRQAVNSSQTTPGSGGNLYV